MKRRREKHLTADDRRLWSLVTRDVRPLGPVAMAGETTQADPAIAPAAPMPTTQEGAGAEGPKSGTADPKRPHSPRTPSEAAAPSPSPALPALARLAPRDRRKVAGGRIPVDATLDLHGLTQAMAHRRLRSFLGAARKQGARLVIVVTGKGGSDRNGDAAGPAAERGVLRRMLPHWLEDPDLRDLVVGFEPAARRHGGEGAFYVRLRRADPKPGTGGPSLSP